MFSLVNRLRNLIYCILLFLLLPVHPAAQAVTSAETVMEKCVRLYKEGKLDSTIVRIHYYKNHFKQIDSVWQLYIYTDTFYLADSFYAVGKLTLDPYMKYNSTPIGLWTCYYPGGAVFAKGRFAIAAYTECQAAGPFAGSYSYKTGEWQYWYADQKPMARGVYTKTKESISTNCGEDWIVISTINNKWIFYDQKGRRAMDSKPIADLIMKRHINF